MKTLTWDELANFYKEETGQSARIKPMDMIFKWAERHEKIQCNDDGTLSFKNS